MIDPQTQANTWIRNVWGIKKEMLDEPEEDENQYDWNKSESEQQVEEDDEKQPDLIILKVDMDENKFVASMKLALTNGNPV